MTQSPLFLTQISTLFDNLFNFCMNHNEFSRHNESITSTIIECFTCLLTLLKHKTIYLHFCKKYSGNFFYQSLMQNYLHLLASLKAPSITTKIFFQTLRFGLLGCLAHFQDFDFHGKN
jgi:hypothetical protein